MSRIRLSKNGIDIAKPGFDVETATLSQMAFSSQHVAARVAYRGTVSVGAYSGSMSNVYYRGRVTFPSAFPNPPVVLVAGVVTGGSEQGAFLVTAIPLTGGGHPATADAYSLPFYTIETFTSRFDLYVLKNFPSGVAAGPGTNTWRYWVLANTLQS